MVFFKKRSAAGEIFAVILHILTIFAVFSAFFMVFFKKMSAAGEIFAVILYILTIFADFTRTDSQGFSRTSQGGDAVSRTDVKDLGGGTKRKSQGAGGHKRNP